jgi:hypothetical protein
MGEIIVVLLLPGMLASGILSGNIHAFPLWMTAMANLAIYFLGVRIIFWTFDLFK